MTLVTDLSLVLRASALEKKPKKFSLVASETDRAGLIERFGLVSLDHLSADIEIRNNGADNGVLVNGHIEAKFSQRCIASLAEVPETLDTTFDLLLVEPEMALRMDEEESYLDPDAPDYDALEGDDIDVGEIVAQTFSISMNPYPRASDNAISAPANPNVTFNEPELEKPNPFAALSKLKDKS